MSDSEYQPSEEDQRGPQNWRSGAPGKAKALGAFQARVFKNYKARNKKSKRDMRVIALTGPPGSGLTLVSH